MLNSIKEQLEENGIGAIIEIGDVSAISRLADETGVILLYLDEALTKDHKLLIYLKDLVTEFDLPVVLVGYPEELEAVCRIMPAHCITRRFERPLNVTKMTKELVDFLEDNPEEEKKKILVVDDSGVALRTVKGWLEDRYQVILANSGMMAIKYLTQDNPDLILLDYDMPIISGKQVLEMIRAESEYASVPVIFLTARDDRDSIIDVMSLRPEGYLLKSMEPSFIIKTIDDFFEKQKGNGYISG